MSIVVTGATGKVGSYLVKRLQARGANHLAASRSPRGENGIHFDWQDESTWAPLIKTAKRVWIVPQAAGFYDVSERVTSFVRACLDQGSVEEFGVLSVRNAEHLNRDIPALKVERMLAATGAPWFSLRPTWFYQNILVGMFRDGICNQGAILAPTAGGKVSFIDADDIAACAETALTSPAGTVSGVQELSGPAALTFADLAEMLSTALNKPVVHSDVSEEEMAAYLIGLGLVPSHVGALINHFARIRAGGSEGIEPGVMRLTGRPPICFTAYLAREAEMVASLRPSDQQGPGRR